MPDSKAWDLTPEEPREAASDDESSFWREAGIKRGSLLWPAAELCEDMGKHALAALLREIGLRHPKPFITGSQAYGRPRPDSDTDICLFTYQHELAYIYGAYPCAVYGSTKRLCLGSYDLILFDDTRCFEAWRSATDYLIERSPVDKQTAVETFKTVVQVTDYQRGMSSVASLGSSAAASGRTTRLYLQREHRNEHGYHHSEPDEQHPH